MKGWALAAGILAFAAAPAFSDAGYKGLSWGAKVEAVSNALPELALRGGAIAEVTPVPPFHPLGEALLYFDASTYDTLYDYNAFPEALLDNNLATDEHPRAYTDLSRPGSPVFWFASGGLAAVTVTFENANALPTLVSEYGAAALRSLVFVALAPYELVPRYDQPRLRRAPYVHWRFSGDSLRIACWRSGDRIIVWDNPGSGLQQVTYLDAAWFASVEKRAVASAERRARLGGLNQIE